MRSAQRTDWFQVNLVIMNEVLEAKFSQYHDLRRMLQETEKRDLVEDSPVSVSAEQKRS